jgi:hypothetical protein|tara:strand:+ start:773 stop:1306 length:534 start_codon:yes stop_codon:yes gene_type:complete
MKFEIGKKKYVIKGLVYVIPLKLLRKTPHVEFYNVHGVLSRLSAIDKVIHEKNAVSPHVKSSKVKRPWYMHTDQEDNLLVHEGKRFIDLYSVKHGKIEKFEATSKYIKYKGKVIYKGAAILGWPIHTFHRVKSPDGSISTNYAKHNKNFNIRTNFNIYDLDIKNGKYKVLREGHKDQ